MYIKLHSYSLESETTIIIIIIIIKIITIKKLDTRQFFKNWLFKMTFPMMLILASYCIKDSQLQ